MENQLRSLFPHFLVIFAFLPVTSSWGQTSKESLFDYLLDRDSIVVQLETDIKQLLRKKDEYQQAQLIIQSRKQIIIDTVVEIRSRGNMRKRVCYLPPVKLRFGKDYLLNHHWEEYPTIKLVTSCSYTGISDTYLDLEYFLYHLYQILTDKSYRAMAITLVYADPLGRKKLSPVHGFMLEHEDQMADHSGGKLYEGPFFKSNSLDRKQYILFSMFQFMIGNTDWKILNKHNLDIVMDEKNRTYYPIPYDFDYSGAVHAVYAVPNESLPIQTVTERIYLGPCQTEAEVFEMISFFQSKKQDIFLELERCLTQENYRDKCAHFIEEFFKILDNKKMALATFTNCRDY